MRGVQLNSLTRYPRGTTAPNFLYYVLYAAFQLVKKYFHFY